MIIVSPFPRCSSRGIDRNVPLSTWVVFFDGNWKEFNMRFPVAFFLTALLIAASVSVAEDAKEEDTAKEGKAGHVASTAQKKPEGRGNQAALDLLDRKQQIDLIEVLKVRNRAKWEFRDAKSIADKDAARQKVEQVVIDNVCCLVSCEMRLKGLPTQPEKESLIMPGAADTQRKARVHYAIPVRFFRIPMAVVFPIKEDAKPSKKGNSGDGNPPMDSLIGAQTKKPESIEIPFIFWTRNEKAKEWVIDNAKTYRVTGRLLVFPGEGISLPGVIADSDIKPVLEEEPKADAPSRPIDTPVGKKNEEMF
jgi:hypothetical protein